MVKEHVEAGQKFGEGIIKFLMAFFLNPYLCLVVFAGLGYALFVALGQVLGIVPSGGNLQDNPPWEVLPVWYTVISIALTVSITVLFRKYIRLAMKWILYLLVGGLVIAFVGGVIAAIIEGVNS